jgi:hypothetical protein
MLKNLLKIEKISMEYHNIDSEKNVFILKKFLNIVSNHTHPPDTHTTRTGFFKAL